MPEFEGKRLVYLPSWLYELRHAPVFDYLKYLALIFS